MSDPRIHHGPYATGGGYLAGALRRGDRIIVPGPWAVVGATVLDVEDEGTDVRIVVAYDTGDGVAFLSDRFEVWPLAEPLPEGRGHRLVDVPEGALLCERCGATVAEARATDCEGEA